MRFLIKRTVCSVTMKLPGGETGQRIRTKIIPHHLQPQARQSAPDRIRTIGGTYKKKRCLIIGSAPSLKKLKISSIPVDYTFLLNRAYLLKDRPKKTREAIVMANPFAFKEYGRDALNRDLDAAFLSSAIDIEDYYCDERVITFSQWEFPRIYDGFFQKDMRKPLYHGTSVAFTAIQIALWMGFEEIVLAGIDFRFDPKTAHFYESSIHEIHRTGSVSRNNSDKMIASLSYCCKFLSETSKSKVVSVSPYRDFDFLEYRTPEEFTLAKS